MLCYCTLYVYNTLLACLWKSSIDDAYVSRNFVIVSMRYMSALLAGNLF